MGKIIFDENLGFPSEFDTDLNQVKWSENAYPEYFGVRKFEKMKNLYENPDDIDDDYEMYFTAGRVSKKECLKDFKNNGVTYEYTIIPAKDINGECNKTHGHVHGVNPETGKSRIEAFEILHGNGCFELFKEIDENEFECLIVLLKKGDKIIVPSDYFHLSINLSNEEPFIFSDLIKDDVDTIYSHVKEKNGGPYRVFHDEKGEVYYKLNSNWKNCNIRFKVISCEKLNWYNPFQKSLYESFVEENKKIKLILEG